MSQIFRWSPAVRIKDSGDKYGVFQCKCPEGTKGAKRYQGETPMVRWDFWAVDCGKLIGRLVWIDKNFNEFNGKTKTSLTLALQTLDGEIDILSLPFDGFALRNVMNHLCGMKDAVFSEQITLTHGVWKKKDSEGKYVTGTDGKQVWSTTLNFDGVSPLYSLSKDVEHNYWELRKQRGIEPVKFVDSKGADSYDDRAEIEFWDKPLVGLQRRLVENGIAIPFSYNSWICGDAVNFSGGGNQPEEIKDEIKRLYETRVKGLFQYFGKDSSSGVAASDVRSALRQPAIEQTHIVNGGAKQAAAAQPDTVLQPSPIQLQQADSFGFADPAKIDWPSEAPPQDFTDGAHGGDDLPF